MSTPLHQWLVARLHAEGPVPFAQFMDWCLYHPEHGYYTSGRVRVGSDAGDFTTAPHVSGLFAGCLARVTAAVDRALEQPGRFTLIEGGPGEGRLAVELLDTLRRREPELYARLAYCLDERSPALLDRQLRALADHRERVCVGIPEFMATGLYISNELVDAMPVERFVRTRGNLEEIFVGAQGETLVELLRPPADPATAAAAGVLATDDGYQVEVRPGLAPWLERVAGCLARGVVLTVDYGDTAERLYGPHRPAGTAVGYRRHRQTNELLAAPGEQDLTAQVDFSAVIRCGETRGLRAAPLCKQREFLFSAGLLSELEALEVSDKSELEKLELRRAAAPLLMPGSGMGDAFKVLVQTKGVAFELGSPPL